MAFSVTPKGKIDVARLQKQPEIQAKSGLSAEQVAKADTNKDGVVDSLEAFQYADRFDHDGSPDTIALFTEDDKISKAGNVYLGMLDLLDNKDLQPLPDYSADWFKAPAFPDQKGLVAQKRADLREYSQAAKDQPAAKKQAFARKYDEVIVAGKDLDKYFSGDILPDSPGKDLPLLDYSMGQYELSIFEGMPEGLRDSLRQRGKIADQLLSFNNRAQDFHKDNRSQIRKGFRSLGLDVPNFSKMNRKQAVESMIQFREALADANVMGEIPEDALRLGELMQKNLWSLED